MEDAASGCQAGKAAGCRVVAIPDPRFDEQQRQELLAPYADIILNSLNDFDGTRFPLNRLRVLSPHPN